jgi:hypothetical protein
MVRRILLWKFVPGLFAMGLYGLPFGSLIVYIEATRLGFTAKQVFVTHSWFLIHYVAAYICAKKKDQLAQKIGQVAASTLSLCIFSLPIFFGSAMLARVSLRQALWGTLIQALVNICFGWLYYLILKIAREYHASLVEKQIEWAAAMKLKTSLAQLVLFLFHFFF